MDIGSSDSNRYDSQWLGSYASNKQYGSNQDIWKMVLPETHVQSKGDFSNLSGTETILSHSPSNEHQMSKDIERQQHRVFLFDEKKSSIFNSQTNRQDISDDRTKWMDNYSRTYQRTGQQGTRCFIQACESGRLPNQIGCLNESASVMVYINYSRCICEQTQRQAQEVLLNLERQQSFRMRLPPLQLERRTSITPPSNTVNVTSHLKGYQITNNSYFHYTAVGKSIMVVATQRYINDEFNIGLERGESDSGTENEEDVVETSSGEDNDFTGQRGEL
ncbi:MAG: hypothetical protein EZS28_052638, partial [Streblomastix strix]